MTYYVSLSGLQNAQTDLNVVANNIANADTTGFKKSTAQFANLVAASAYSNPKNTIGIGSTVETINQNFSQGPVEQTGSALDVAISGNGFFTVKSPIDAQTYYTRNGNFAIDARASAGGGNSYVVDGDGNRMQVLPTSGAGVVTSNTPADAVVAPANAAGAAFAGLTIAKNGDVSAAYADGTSTVIGAVALATFNAPEGLQQQGSSRYTATGQSGSATYGQPGTSQYGGLLSGALEASNVDLSAELVNLITAQQYFQANSKAIDTNTTIYEAIINLHT